MCVSSQNTSLTETVLWENQNPSSLFSEQSITLDVGKKFSDYKYIKITGKWSTSDNKSICVMYPYEDFISTSWFNWDNTMRIGAALISMNGPEIRSWYLRTISYVSDTTMIISVGVPFSNIGISDSSKCIPLQIIGLK